MTKKFDKYDNEMKSGSSKFSEKSGKKKASSKYEDEEETPKNKRTNFDSSDEEQEKKSSKKQQKRVRDSDSEEEVKTKSKKSESEEESTPKKQKKEKKSTNNNNSSIRKNYYAESSKIAKASQKEVDEYRSSNNITISTGDDSSFKPIRAFDEIAFSDESSKSEAFASMWKSATSKFQKPSPIQAQTWPVALSGRDVVGIAETGSGKTLAFLLPAFAHVMDRQNPAKKRVPSVLILSPTRELAMQIAEVATELGKSSSVRSICLYGGVNKDTQRNTLAKGVDVIVATPGRLLDLVSENSCNLTDISYLILDEADRMLDMGFEKDIRALISLIQTPQKDRQTLMFSATWPVIIQQLANEFLTNPVRVTIGSADLQANHRVKQIVEVIDDRARDNRLLELLSQYHNKKNRVLIFVLYKKEAPRLEELLKRRRFVCESIHSDKSQAQRTAAFEGFRSGQVPLLIATDVAARGLDIPDVEYVINYSFPLTIEDYVHRIGRTGRGGKEGVSHTFFTNFDKGKAGELANVLRDANMDVPHELLKFGTHVKKKEHALYGNHFKAQAGPPKEKAHIKFDD